MLRMLGQITPVLVLSGLGVTTFILMIFLGIVVIAGASLLCVVGLPVGIPFLVFDKVYQGTRLTKEQSIGAATLVFLLLCTMYGIIIYQGFYV